MRNVVRGCAEILPRCWSRTEYGNLYPPQSFKIVAFYCRSTFVCTSRLMSTVVPSFNSTVPTTCFSFTTHVVLVFPLNSGETHLWKAFRKRNIWEKNLTHEETMKITLKNERQIKFSLFPMTYSFENCYWLAKKSAGLPDCSLKKSAQEKCCTIYRAVKREREKWELLQIDDC